MGIKGDNRAWSRSRAGWLAATASLLACCPFGFAARANDVERSLDSTRINTGATSDEDEAVETHDAIVALLNERGFACSGVLVHPRAVLSARHCRGIRLAVFGNDTNRLLMQRRIVSSHTPTERGVDLVLFELDEPAPVEPYTFSFPADPPNDVRIVGFGCLVSVQGCG